MYLEVPQGDFLGPSRAGVVARDGNRRRAADEEDKSGSQESTKETGNTHISWVPGSQISLQSLFSSYP
jgi:hypothetical protein